MEKKTFQQLTVGLAVLVVFLAVTVIALIGRNASLGKRLQQASDIYSAADVDETGLRVELDILREEVEAAEARYNQAVAAFTTLYNRMLGVRNGLNLALERAMDSNAKVRATLLSDTLDTSDKLRGCVGEHDQLRVDIMALVVGFAESDPDSNRVFNKTVADWNARNPNWETAKIE